MKNIVLFIILLIGVAFFYLKATSENKAERLENNPTLSIIPNQPLSVDSTIYNKAFRYCFDGEWTEIDKGIVRNGFLSWSDTKVSFIESVPPNCDTIIYADYSFPYPGEATIMPEYIRVNPSQLTVLVATHEIGHNLGLPHEDAGLMRAYINGELGVSTAVPSPENIRMVKEIWEITE